MISEIATWLPETKLSNEQLVQELGRWTADEVFSKTGIRNRCIAAHGETAVDLAVEALKAIRARAALDALDFLLFCTQTGDYKLPSSACLAQARAGIPSTCGCLDINLACSGFIYCLSLAESLTNSGQASNVIIVNSDTYSHYIHPQDSICRPIFGDGAAATLITTGNRGRVYGFSFGTDGSRAASMTLQAGGAKHPQYRVGGERAPRDPEFIQMNGPEIYNFTLGVVPAILDATLGRAGLTLSQIDYFVFHQANGFMLEALRRKLSIEPSRFVVDMEQTGNLVSASIPVVLANMQKRGQLISGTRTLLCGFGVGLSWGACVVDW